MYPDPNRKSRFGLLDLIIIGAVAGFAGFLWYRVSDVLVYRWDWSFLPRALFRPNAETGGWEPNLLLEGLFTTFRLSIWAMLIASLLGLVLGVMASCVRLLPRLTSSAYVGLIRNVPPLVFLFVFYFFVSSQIIPMLGIDTWSRNLGPGAERIVGFLAGPPALLENFIAGVISLAMFEAAYIAVIVRSGIESVSQQQIEAAESLGLRPGQAFRLVVFPQALQAVTPSLANQFIMLVKDSSIVSLISVQELTFVGTELAVSSQRRFETYIVVALFYFLLCFALSRLFARLEARQRRSA
ncbi:MAG: amino acid ABC transporter permease [Confluentimicrobium sp.]|jgi:polar amino acid transport system permease protein|uniref:amino acid ABC transporter permease n=1 Tax=Actibacterium sp. TaxID=1872125 RepID=UPI00050E4E22|nr:amino acid ABC transporter permease [Actibacterium sp.]KGB81278.1 amino acid ABC transporter permease [Rhodovulum sp. NI22]MBC57196.1 amino acid ABC transporter permease [Actibacterium sp.]MDY6859821.1 amino acid ABC transporter permease [Pseudomonadota bacterium]|tara:strand:+ start:1957 stop:2847 length:891 start_codon:yes stop_codon:yes gene_type:complete